MTNEENFTLIIKENAGIVYKVAKVYTNSNEDEQDLYQEILYQLWKSFASFRRESKATTWMYRVALNTAIAFLNKEKKKGVSVPIDAALLNEPDAADTAYHARSELLFACIRQLNDIEKGIILLYLEGRSYEEIAGVTGFTITNVATRLARIRQKLTNKLN